MRTTPQHKIRTLIKHWENEKTAKQRKSDIVKRIPLNTEIIITNRKRVALKRFNTMLARELRRDAFIDAYTKFGLYYGTEGLDRTHDLMSLTIKASKDVRKEFRENVLEV